MKQVDSIAARGSYIFLVVLLRDSVGSRHAVNIDIQKYVMLCNILWLASYFYNRVIWVYLFWDMTCSYVETYGEIFVSSP